MNLSSSGAISTPQTTENDTGSVASPTQSSLEVVVTLLSFYWTPIVSIAGILANTAVVVVLTRRPFPGASNWAMYVVGIAVAETVHLATRLDGWISTTLGLDLYGRIGGWCQLVTFLADAAECLVLWYAVCLGVDRVVRRLQPTPPARLVTTPTFARTALVCLGVVAIIVYVNTSITFGEMRYERMSTSVCMALAMFEDVLFRLATAGVFVNSALPLCLISVSELFIGVAVFRRGGPRYHLRLTPSTSSATAAEQTTGTGGSQQRETEMERSLANLDADRSTFFFLFCFLLTNLPIHVFNGVHVFWSLAAGRNLGFGLWQYLMQSVLEELKNTNEAASVLLLAATSRVFREAFGRTVSALLRRESSCQGQDGIECSV